MRKELIRKGIHTSIALGFAFLSAYTSKEVLLFLSFGLFVVFSVVRFLRIFAHIGMVPRVTFGELFFAIGVAGAVLLTWPHVEVFQVSMYILAFADPIAALVGMNFGRHQYRVLDEKRSLEGSSACFLIIFLILFFLQTPVLFAGGIALVLTLVEAFSLRGSDNLTLPIATILLFALV